MQAVVQKMCEEMEEKAKQYQGLIVKHLYIGGGTPSLLPPHLMDTLLTKVHATFSFVENAECSMEVNPGAIAEGFFSLLPFHGINRISVGVQSASDRLLKTLGRVHTFSQAKATILALKNAGIQNINCDMMLGLYGQSVEDVLSTLHSFFALDLTHISCYGLIVEEGTPLFDKVHQGLWQLPVEETERQMYDLARKELEMHGFMQYEISNFAKQGYECRHNMDCWQRGEYLGIGCSACGFMGDRRTQNDPTLQGYLRGAPPTVTKISKEDAMFESVMLGLRMKKGVSEKAFYAMHGCTLLQAFGAKLQKAMRSGGLVLEDGRLFLTRKGMDIQNAILLDLMD